MCVCLPACLPAWLSVCLSGCLSVPTTSKTKKVNIIPPTSPSYPGYPWPSLVGPGLTFFPNLRSKLLRLDKSSGSGISWAHSEGSITAC